MRDRHGLVWLGGVLIAAFVLVGVRAGLAQEEAPALAQGGLTVAVVDVSDVMRRSVDWQNATQKRMDMMEQMRRTLERQSRQAQVLRNEYEALPPGTEERLSKEDELRRALAELQQARHEFEEELITHHEQAVRSFYARLRQAVADHARQGGLDLVFKTEGTDLSGPVTPEQSLQLATAEVLYARPELDISDAIVERLNADLAEPMEVK